MAESNGSGKYPTWKWLVGVLVGILLLTAGGWVSRIESRMTEKVDKDQYRCDIGEIKSDIRWMRENWSKR